MARKLRKTITKNIYDIILSMFRTRKFSIKQISEATNINKNTVSKQIKLIEEGVSFESGPNKLKKTNKIKAEVIDHVEVSIINFIGRQNSSTQIETQKFIESKHKN